MPNIVVAMKYLSLDRGLLLVRDDLVFNGGRLSSAKNVCEIPTIR